MIYYDIVGLLLHYLFYCSTPLYLTRPDKTVVVDETETSNKGLGRSIEHYLSYYRHIALYVFLSLCLTSTLCVLYSPVGRINRSLGDIEKAASLIKKSLSMRKAIFLTRTLHPCILQARQVSPFPFFEVQCGISFSLSTLSFSSSTLSFSSSFSSFSVYFLLYLSL